MARLSEPMGSLVSGQDSVDDLVLCLSDELRLEVTSEMEDSLENIMEEDLMGAKRRRLSGTNVSLV